MSYESTQSFLAVLYGIVLPLVVGLLGVALALLSFRGAFRTRDALVERVYFTTLAASSVTRHGSRATMSTSPRGGVSLPLFRREYSQASSAGTTVAKTAAEAAEPDMPPTTRLISTPVAAAAAPRTHRRSSFAKPGPLLRNTSVLSQPSHMKWANLPSHSEAREGGGELVWRLRFVRSHLLQFHLWTFLVGLTSACAAFSALVFDRLTAQNVRVQDTIVVLPVICFYCTVANFIRLLTLAFTNMSRRGFILVHGLKLVVAFLWVLWIAGSVAAAITVSGDSTFDQVIDYASMATSGVLGVMCVAMQFQVGNSKSMPRFILPVLAIACGVKLIVTTHGVQRRLVPALGECFVPLWVAVPLIPVLIIEIAVEVHRFAVDEDDDGLA